MNDEGQRQLIDPTTEPLLHPSPTEKPSMLPLTISEIRKRIISASWPQASVVACRLATDLTDVAILGHLGTDELAGSAFAGVVTTISSVVLWQGFGDALITLSSQAVGAGNPKLAGTWLQTSLLCCTVGSIPVCIIWWFAGDLLSFAPGVDEDVVHFAKLFARWSIIWLWPDACFGAFSQWLNGQQKVKPTIFINFIFVFVNAGLNYLLIFGIEGHFSGLGFIGSPIATSITKILRGLCLIYYCISVRSLHVDCWGGWDRSSISKIRLKRFFAQAIPAALVGLVEQAQFVFITIMISTIGEAELAAHSGMLNIFSLMSSAMYGLTDAGASTVGLLLGAGRNDLAKSASYVLLKLMFVMAVFVAILFISTHSIIGRIFSNDYEVIELSSSLALILSISYCLLSITFACFGTLQGQGRPHIAAVSMFFGLWGLSVPCAYLFGIKESLGLVGVWWGLVVGYSVMTFVMCGFVMKSDWVKLEENARKRSEAPGT